MKNLSLLIVLFLFIFSAQAQNNKTLLEIGGEKIGVDEFLHIYKKNNSSDFEKKDVNEYLELYINFKLKVLEAQNLKMDTGNVFKDEYAGYKYQLAKNYISENEIVKKQMERAYERNKTEFKFDHILIKVAKGANAKTRNIAYKKALGIKKRLDKGEDFEKIVAEVSDDKSASRTKGHFWYMAAAKIPFKIQEFAFDDKTGKYSDPILTKFGYHIVKVIDKREALGSVKVKHIMILASQDASKEEQELAKHKIDSIYAKIKEGEKFENLVKLSDDKGTSNKGGELPWFTTGRMVPEFETAAFSLKEKEEITKPIKTMFGWHIIKLADTKDYPSYKESEKSIKEMIGRDPEMQEEAKEYVLRKLKKEFDFKEISNPKDLFKKLDSTVFDAKWEIKNEDAFTKSLFTIKSGQDSQKKIIFNELDFANFIENSQKKQKSIDLKTYITQIYNDFIYKTLVDAEIETLPEKYPEYKYLINEYYAGILLFDITDSVVWRKAVEDTIGLKKFYQSRKKDYAGMVKLDLSIFEYSGKKALNKAKPILTSKKSDNLTDEEIVNKISKGKNTLKLLEAKTYSEGENKYADKVFELEKNGKIIENQKFVLLKNENVIIALNKIEKIGEKSFDQIKGIIIADYQNYLDTKWIKELRKKYKVEVNKDVLDGIK